jgi:hypothetical protein
VNGYPSGGNTRGGRRLSPHLQVVTPYRTPSATPRTSIEAGVVGRTRDGTKIPDAGRRLCPTLSTLGAGRHGRSMMGKGPTSTPTARAIFTTSIALRTWA